MSLTINNIEFRTKKQAEMYIRAILERDRTRQCNPRMGCAGHPVDEGESRFLLAVLDKHPNKSVIAEGGVKEFRVQHLHPPLKGIRFLLIRKDGEMRDFTWRYALTPRNPQQHVHSVCRFLVRSQIRLARDAAFGPLDCVHCPVTGQLITLDGCDVDHIPPDTFQNLVARWIKSEGVDYPSIEIVPSAQYETEGRFIDDSMAARWIEFHRANAKLRVVSSFANMSLIRRAKV